MADVPKYEDTSPIAEKPPLYEETSPHPDVTDPEDIPGPIESGIRGAGQGLTFGLSDEAAAGIQAALDVGTSKDKKITDLKKMYEIYKGLQQEREDAAQKANPKVYGGTELAGSLATSLVPVGQANTVADAAKLAALYGFGKSKGSLANGDIGQVTKDTLVGGGLGLGGYGIGKGIGTLASRSGVGQAFKNAGENLQGEGQDVALSALGASSKDIKKERGLSMFSNPEYRKGIGEEALNKIGFTGGPEVVREKAVQRINDIEDIKDPLLEKANDELQNIRQFPTSSELENLNKGSLKDQLSELKDSIMGHKESLGLETDVLQNKFDKISDALASKDNNILALNDVKKSIGKELGSEAFKKTAQELPEQAEFLRKSYSLVNKRIEDLADKVGPQFGQKIKAMNQEESNLLDLGNIAFNTETKNATGAGHGVGDYLAGGAGAGIATAIAGPYASIPGWLAGIGTKKAAEKITGWNAGQFGKIGAAKTLNAVGNAGQQIGQALESPSVGASIARTALESQKEREMKPMNLSQDLYKASDDDLKSVADRLSGNEQYANYGKALNDAIQNKSPIKKNAVLFTMLQNPNIRKYINGEQDEGQ